jgi:tetratricopeptide (TPR) repeat protein
MRPELKTLTGGIEVALGARLSFANTPPPFFGRAPALEALKAVAEHVRSAGECRCVTVVGAAGIGKTRLIDEFVRAAVHPSEERPTRVFRSSATNGNTPWSCFTQLLVQRFDVVDALGPEEAKLGVRTQVATLFDDRKVGDILHVLGGLIGLEFPDSPITKALGDSAVDASMPKRAILKSLLEVDVAQGPLCLVLDDLHLAHQQTIDMLHFLVENLRGPVMFVCAARPELLARPEVRPQSPRHSVLHLEPLGEVDTAALIGSLLSPGGLTPMHVVEQAREVTGGNPGRIEETARYYRDRGTLPPPPSGPESALQARIDELGPADRLLLQRAALMGGVFWFGGLVVLDRADRVAPALWNEEDDESRLDITDRLQRLTERDYVMRLPDSTFPGDEEYVFRHRQERERISALTSPTDARKWHRLLADWLDSKPEIRTHEQYLEMLAEQREKSGISDWAARAYLEAAARVRTQHVLKRELGYYEKALALLGEHDYGRRLDALLRTGELLEGLDRAEDALDRYREALMLAFRLDRHASWVPARLAATRLLAKLGLTDESMTHLESQIPPAPEFTIDVVESTSNPAMVAAPEVEVPATAAAPTAAATPREESGSVEVAVPAAAAFLAEDDASQIAAADAGTTNETAPYAFPAAAAYEIAGGEIAAAAAEPPRQPILPREPVTSRGPGPEYAPMSGAVSSSRVTRPDAEDPPSAAYRSEPRIPIVEPVDPLVAAAEPSGPVAKPRGFEDEITAVGKVDLDAITAVGIVHFPPDGPAADPAPLAPIPSPNPSDPGTEATSHGDLTLVPEPGIAMAAAATNGDPHTT